MSRNYALINKETLNYIVKQKEVTLDYISKKIKITPEKINNLLDSNNNQLLTIKQAKSLASCLHVPFAALYMNQKDIQLKRIPQYRNRRVNYADTPYDDSSLKIAIIDALYERDFLIETNKDFSFHTKVFAPIQPHNDNPPDTWANEIKKQFSIEDISSFRSFSPRKFYLYLKQKIEEQGIFIYCFTDVPVQCARGFSILQDSLPIIGINNEDRHPAKIFSIIHELVHLFKRESSVCNTLYDSENKQDIEVFCNAVAGEFLVPKRKLFEYTKNKVSYSANEIKEIARRFYVSRDVIIRRLYDLDEINYDTYCAFAETFKRELMQDNEEKRQNNEKPNFRKFIGRDVFDQTSLHISKILYHGYNKGIYSQYYLSKYLGINSKHLNGFLSEASKIKWHN